MGALGSEDIAQPLTPSFLLQGSLGPMTLGMVSQTQETKCSGVGEPKAQGLGGNDWSLLQGMGWKLWCTPKPRHQPLKEMVRNEQGKAWWLTPVIPTPWEAEVDGSQGQEITILLVNMVKPRLC